MFTYICMYLVIYLSCLHKIKSVLLFLLSLITCKAPFVCDDIESGCGGLPLVPSTYHGDAVPHHAVHEF